MRYEVDVLVHHPLDENARAFLDSVIPSANQVLRYRAEGERMVVTVEAHALDEEGALPAAIREIARVYPLEKVEVVGEPRELRRPRE
jgi:hypothetical protein